MITFDEVRELSRQTSELEVRVMEGESFERFADDLLSACALTIERLLENEDERDE